MTYRHVHSNRDQHGLMEENHERASDDAVNLCEYRQLFLSFERRVVFVVPSLLSQPMGFSY
jgi:hypothetical protein